jgi:hypothetical protein
VPDSMLGDDPAAVKTGLKAAYRQTLEDYDFEHVLLSHGGPIVGDGREQLRAFVAD